MMKLVREYAKYDEYLEHQKEKSLNAKRIEQWLNEQWLPKVEMFTEHFQRNDKYLIKGGRALGVCARTGQEVEALNKMGMDAIGIDIVPYPPLVVEGDAHNLPFKDSCFEFVFSNSLDHSIYPKVFLNEIIRVLKPGGYGMLHLQITDDVDIYAENILLDYDWVTDILIFQEIKANRQIEDICYNREIIFKKVV